ncbi:MAG: BON domain-containing protein [Chloroflexi bacterium]|nr:BON domain-containing protein [Chloroflexota bacterium]
MSVSQARTDLEISQDVMDALTSDVRLKITNLGVDVVGGTVYISGNVSHLYEKKTATEVSNRIKGVLEVVNTLGVVPEEQRSDDAIVADVEAALSRNIWVDEQRIGVSCTCGVVTLSGQVVSYTEKSAAEGDAWSVAGVRDVVNEITIFPIAPTPDEEIAESVREDLTRNIRVDPSKVQVEVHSGVVYLKGTVGTVPQKWLVDDLAWWTAGVTDVVNELTVTG